MDKLFSAGLGIYGMSAAMALSSAAMSSMPCFMRCTNRGVGVRLPHAYCDSCTLFMPVFCAMAARVVLSFVMASAADGSKTKWKV